jgi:peptidoglycan/LPS O-acetylase OafA/YrhL
MKHLTTPPEMSKVPGEWVGIISRALSKNPAHRYANMAEMARDVETVGQPGSRPAGARGPVSPGGKGEVGRVRAATPEPMTALPAVPARQAVMELSWSMSVTVAFAALATALWAALRQEQYQDWTHLSSMFFLTVAAAWAILIPAKMWTERRGDSWTRRIVMLGLGGLVGLLACWLDGWAPGRAWRFEEISTEASVRLFPRNVALEASYFSYYALAFFALRWWRMTSRRRPQRFSFAPILAAGFWGVVLLLLIRPQHQPTPVMAAVVLVMAATIVQLVSPWEQPPAPTARRVRLRYA